MVIHTTELSTLKVNFVIIHLIVSKYKFSGVQIPIFNFTLLLFTCRYNDVDDEHWATDLMITANEDFSNIQSSRVTVSLYSWWLWMCHGFINNYLPSWLFSWLHLPTCLESQPISWFLIIQVYSGTKDSIILALKSEENKDKIVTCILKTARTIPMVTVVQFLTVLDILVFDLAGRVLMDETIIGKLKQVFISLLFSYCYFPLFQIWRCRIYMRTDLPSAAATIIHSLCLVIVYAQLLNTVLLVLSTFEYLAHKIHAHIQGVPHWKVTDTRPKSGWVG